MCATHAMVFAYLAVVLPTLVTGSLHGTRRLKVPVHPQSVVAFAREHEKAPLEDQDFLSDYPDKKVEEKLPEQGYTRNHTRAKNPPVAHENWESATADWGQEYGAEEHQYGEGSTETSGPDYQSKATKKAAAKKPESP